MTFSFKKVFLVLVIMLGLASVCFASENRISSVAISKSKDIINGYELTIDSTGSATYKTKVVNDNNIIFELKNSVLEEDAGTFYNDVNDIDSVTVKQSAPNRVRIYIQGQNVQNTELIFVNSLFEADNQKAKKITLSQPINRYQPTNNLAEVDTSQEWNDNSFNMSQLIATVMDGLKQGNTGLILIILATIVLGAFIIKSIARKYEQDSEPLIGLNNNYNTYSAVINQNNDTLKKRSESIKNAQKELQKAHQKYQEYLQDKYKGTYKEKPVNVDAVKKGIALSQYQKNEKNPYMNQPVLKMRDLREDFSQKEIPEKKLNNTFIPHRPKAETQNFTSPYIKRADKSLDNLNTSTKMGSISETPAPQKTRVGSINFLESVTKIYEQSGRIDLANDLKNKMTKARK